MEKIKLFLEKFPSLYSLLQKIYGKGRILKEQIMKTNISEKEQKRWQDRHLHEGEDWAVQGYWEARNYPATKYLAERIGKFAPISSVLEIGCNCGPNLYPIARKFPDSDIKGIDISSSAIKQGNELFRKEGIYNVNLIECKADDLSIFKDKSFDIVFSKSVLCHIGPEKIVNVVKEMVRLSKKAVIIMEYYCDSLEDKDGLGARLDYSWRWKRNYPALIKKFAPEAKINLTKISKEIWGDEWAKMGYIIEVIL